MTALRTSRLSIHDLTRAHGDDVTQLSRFNMPFELGMAYFMARNAETQDDPHEWLMLLPEDQPYGHFISDLAGYDPPTHDGTPGSIVGPVLAWLTVHSKYPIPPSVNPQNLIPLLEEYEQLIEAKQITWQNCLPWLRTVEVARDLIASRL